MVTLGDEGEDRINTLTRVTAALNTDLENVTSELDQTQDQLMDSHVRIRQLEAQLAGRAPPPPQEDEPSFPSLSPARKKRRIGEPGPITHLED